MDQTSDQIERHIQETRNELGDNFSELGEKVRTAVDWRAQFEERPGTMLALAFGGGILLSALLPSSRPSRRRFPGTRMPAQLDLETPPETAANLRTTFGDKPRQGVETWDALKAALIGVATAKLSGFVEELVPGFQQQFTKAQSGDKFSRPASSTSDTPAWQKSAAAGAD
jgi:hypothetical protein